MLFSHHSHSGQFCKHAVGTLEEVVKAAIAKGFKIYGLTEHVPRYRTEDLYPEEQGLPLEHLSQTFDAFVAEAHRLKNLYAGQITLLVGLETEYITPADFAGLDRLLEKYGPLIEYIVGSVHHANDIPIDFDEPAFERALQSFSASISDDHTVLLERLYIAYFDAQFELMQRYKPEVIAHFDLCRLYYPSFKFEGFPEVWTRIVRNVDYAVEYGALFELNAAAFRKGWETAYPGSDIVRYIKQRSGHFTASDDSHGPLAVG
ncbi:hypothetical protein M422DRAFT_196875, partial [Sphaerobolus stellatus SS14]